MKTLLKAILFALSLIITVSPLMAQKNVSQSDVKSAMRNATQFMVEKVSTNGGYVAHYLPDLSRRWGELEAFETQIWIQDPATVGMGNVFLDAYRATGDEYYYNAATAVARALIWGQHSSGGWNYIVDFAGERSLRHWYNTIGKNAWGFEEYNHYYGNATFDDLNTVDPATFLLRMYLEKRQPEFRPAIDKVINFVLTAQYPLGGWPQRYPLKHDHPQHGKEDYTSFYTFNDDVIWGNIQFLIQCYYALGEQRVLDAIHRGMNFYILTQQGNPQGGWGQQYNMNLEPAHARSYEPPSLMPALTFGHAMLMLKFYEFTGDRRYITRIPDAIAWLESTRLPADRAENGTKTHPTFVELKTNKAIYPHRKGTGVTDGHYWWDYNDANLLAHYGGKASVNIELLRKEFERLSMLPSNELMAKSPLAVKGSSLNNTLTLYQFSAPPYTASADKALVTEVINKLDPEGRWLIKNVQISRPYAISAEGVETNTAKLSDENGKGIGDTSGQQYISTREYMKNMNILLDFIGRDRR